MRILLDGDIKHGMTKILYTVYLLYDIEYLDMILYIFQKSPEQYFTISYYSVLERVRGGGTVGHDPQNKDFSNFFVYKSKMRQKRKKPAFFPPKRCMVFADGLEIKFYPILMSQSFRLAH